MSLGRGIWRQTRASLQELVKNYTKLTSDQFEAVFIPVVELEMMLPVNVGDYTDFYASKEHATNVGTMFRGRDNALMPNWYFNDVYIATLF